MTKDTYKAIGLMSGTSIDGVDAALIKTDGETIIEELGFASITYSDEDRDSIKACLGLRKEKDGLISKAEEVIHNTHMTVIDQLNASDVDIIGFHGHTVTHAPEDKFTWQIGDAARLAVEAKIDVVGKFRNDDVDAGGQGAPLLPVYHQALMKSKNLPLPIAILNLGGVGNFTYLGDDDGLMAFDTGPANSLIDDFIKLRTGKPFDMDGKIAASGHYNVELMNKWLENEYFAKEPPKSLDREVWNKVLDDVKDMSNADGAANLTTLTVLTAVIGMTYFEKDPYQIFVTGGGRNNIAVMEGLEDSLECSLRNIDEIGCNGDAIEAQGFAYMAVRSLKGLPISFPYTTGIPSPMTGGTLYKS